MPLLVEEARAVPTQHYSDERADDGGADVSALVVGLPDLGQKLCALKRSVDVRSPSPSTTALQVRRHPPRWPHSDRACNCPRLDP